MQEGQWAPDRECEEFVCLVVVVQLFALSGGWLKGLRPGYADACPLHSRVERAVHADLAGGWVAEYSTCYGRLLYVQMRQNSEEEGHARRCTQEDYLTLKIMPTNIM